MIVPFRERPQVLQPSNQRTQSAGSPGGDPVQAWQTGLRQVRQTRVLQWTVPSGSRTQVLQPS